MGYPTKKLGEVGKIITGNTPSKNNSDFWGGNTLFVKPPYLGNGNVVNFTEETLSDLGREKGKIIKKNSIMVCCIGSLGKTGIAGQDLCTNQQINSIYFDEKLVEFRYGYYFCTTLEKTMNLMANKAVVAIINKSLFSTIPIPLPPLSTQKLIVQKLDQSFEKIDKSIELTKKNLEDIEELNKSVLRKIFNKSNFNEKSINDISENVQYGYTGKTIENGNIRYLRITDIQNNNILWGDVPFVNIDEKEVNKYSLNNGDIVFARTGATVGKSCLIDEEGVGNVFASYLIRIVSNKRLINPEYMQYFFYSKKYWDQVYADVVGAAQPNFNGTKLKQIKIPLPTLEKQKEIVLYLDGVFEKNKILKEKYVKKLKDLEEMKQSILKEAFEGRLVKE